MCLDGPTKRWSAPVTVVDSQQLSLGVGFVAEAAAQATAEGLPLRHVLARIDDRIKRMHVFAALDPSNT
jgi:fatty acid-binding protein DegV